MKSDILDNFFLLVHITLHMAMMLLVEYSLKTDRGDQPGKEGAYGFGGGA